MSRVSPKITGKRIDFKKIKPGDKVGMLSRGPEYLVLRVFYNPILRKTTLDLETLGSGKTWKDQFVGHGWYMFVDEMKCVECGEMMREIDYLCERCR